MSSRILAIFAVSLLIFSCAESAPAVSKARQFLPALPGYIPVYIRPGDTPLEDINPDLATAFNSYAQKHARLAFARANDIPGGTIHVSIAQPANVSEVKDISLVTLDEDIPLEEENTVNTSTKSAILNSQHIQKIPKA